MSVKKHEHLDANESLFFYRQLELIKAKVYENKYPELMARSLFPVSFEGGPAIDTITYRMLDVVGMAKIIANYATDLPRVDLLGKEFTAKVKAFGSSYGYTIDEIRKAAMLGIALSQKKANTARMAHLQLENRIAFAGDSANGLQGFVNMPNINTVTITGAWSGKTADQILTDLNAIANKATEMTNMVERSDTILMPLAQYNLISTKRLGTTEETTVKKFFLENNPYIKEIIPVNELKGAGTAGADVIMAYTKSPEKLEMAVPSDFEQFPEQAKGLEYEVPCLSKFAGILCYYPMSITKGEGL